jgi:hypothetical protein
MLAEKDAAAALPRVLLVARDEPLRAASELPELDRDLVVVERPGKERDVFELPYRVVVALLFQGPDLVDRGTVDRLHEGVFGREAGRQTAVRDDDSSLEDILWLGRQGHRRDQNVPRTNAVTRLNFNIATLV